MARVRCGNKECGKYIKRDETTQRYGWSFFCDESCKYTYMLTIDKPKVASAIPGGNTGAVRGMGVQKRNSVLERDRNKCRVCGASKHLEIHHINYRSDWRNKNWENERWNLITLCGSCHKDVVHNDKKTWVPILLGLTWRSEVDNMYCSVADIVALTKERTSI